jgi:preprotein translocase subunit SecD
LKNFTFRLTLVAIVLALALLFLWPTVNQWFVDKDKDHTAWPHKVINLGLDLQGGMHLVLEVQTQEAVVSTMDRYSDDLKEGLRREHIRSKDQDLINGDTLTVTIIGSEALDKFKKWAGEEMSELVPDYDTQGENTVCTFTLPESDQKAIMDSSRDQALETIRNRIDKLGVSEPDIRKQGEKRILVQLPGVTDTQRAKDILVSTAQLQFRLLDDRQDQVRDYINRRPPPGTEILYSKNVDAEGRVSSRPYLVKKKVLLTGEYLEKAYANMQGQFSEPVVSIEFNKKGGFKFARITGENVGKPLAIVLDGRVFSAPVIQEKISGGQAVITGIGNMQEASDLAIILQAGALPVSLKILEERTVGASLGKDSIKTSTNAMLIGFVLVVIFMAVYYMGAGLIANVALVLNVVLILASLALLDATLTLPGIAGIILTIGMAVDANVLIFERIREEIRTGKAPAFAVDSGFSKATITILDANVTTFVAAFVLLQFGTGPVKGFAVTLCFGIAASMFTAIVVSRLIFDYFLYYRNVRKLSI